MKRLILLAGLSALVPTAALAATPHLDGSYLMTETYFCPGTANENGAITNGGDVHQMIGEATVTPSQSDGPSGTMKFSVINNDGPFVILNGNGKFTKTTENGTGAYSFSGTKFTITPEGRSAATYSAFPGLANSAGVVQDLFALRIDGDGCSDEFILRSK